MDLKVSLLFGNFANMSRQDLVKIIREALEKKGFSAKEASQMAVGNDSLIANIGRSRYGAPRFDTLEALADVLDLELYFGPVRDDPSALDLLDLSRRADQLIGKIHGDDFEAVPRYDVFLAAGDGRLNDEGEPVEHLLFSRPWLRRMGVAPDMGALLTVTGDSMEPLLAEGDLVLVDRDRFEPVSGKVYAFNDTDNGARVKFIDLLPGKGGIVLRSANQSHAPEYRVGAEADEITRTIIGQVVWSGHVWV